MCMCLGGSKRTIRQIQVITNILHSDIYKYIYIPNIKPEKKTHILIKENKQQL